MKKRLIVVGNKQIHVDMSKQIDSFDIVVRLNRMTNYGLSGTKTDILLVDLHREFFKLVEPPFDKYQLAKKLLVNIDQPAKNKFVAMSKGIFSSNQLFKADKMSSSKISKQLLGEHDFMKEKCRPTNFFLLTTYMLEKHSDEYEIWIACVDIDNRDVVFNNESAYENSWHLNIGQYESMMLNKWISEGKLKVLNA